MVRINDRPRIVRMSHALFPSFSECDGTDLVRRQVASGNHRKPIGGLWSELGNLQADFLKSRGLLPHHVLIDIGAGCFRAGVRLVPYLEPGNYYAIDKHAALLEAGYAREIEPAGLANRFPRGNFVATADFDIIRFGRAFDFGIAQSVFTHMPIARLKDCLTAVAPHFLPGGQFLITVFLAPDAISGRPCTQMPGGIVTFPNSNPFHTTLAALSHFASQATEWQMSVIGDWGHPRNQQMVCFTRCH
jgi:hypothetical protein